MTSLYKIAEQVRSLLGKGEPQELIEAVRQSFATAVRLMWYEGKQNDLSEMNGTFIYSFVDQVPVQDEKTFQWYINTPSTSIGLPHDMEITEVSYMPKSECSDIRPFVRIGAAGFGMYKNLKSAGMGGNMQYVVENSRIIFPTMNRSTSWNILLKLAVATDMADVDEDINIPQNVIDTILQMVTQKYAPKVENTQMLDN